MGDNPNSPDDGGGGDEPASKNHDIVAAINSLEAKYDAAQKNRPEHDRQTLAWTRRTAQGVFIYTGLTACITIAAICSALYARRSLKLTQEIFNADQRPIIWLTDHTDIPQYLAETKRVAWNWEYTNYGKSPALHIHFKTFMSLDAGAFVRDFDDSLGIGSPIPPNKKDFATVFSKSAVDQADFTRIMAIDSGIRISGIVEYYDVGGHSYQTTFCLGHLKGGAVAYQPLSADCQNDIR